MDNHTADGFVQVADHGKEHWPNNINLQKGYHKGTSAHTFYKVLCFAALWLLVCTAMEADFLEGIITIAADLPAKPTISRCPNSSIYRLKYFGFICEVQVNDKHNNNNDNNNNKGYTNKNLTVASDG